MKHMMVLCLLALLAAAPPAEAEEVPPPDAAVKARLVPFFEGLRAAEKTDTAHIARIAWWGDSAIVSDGYTGTVRERLQARFGDAGPGFILPTTTFDGYLRAGVRLLRNNWTAYNVIQGNLSSGLYGIGGIQASSWGGASSTFETQAAPFTRVEVFYRAFPKAGGIQIFADDAGSATETHDAEATAPTDQVWRWTAPEGGVKKVRVRAAGKGETVLYGVALERGDNGVVLDAFGLLGMRARRWLNADAAHIKAQLAQRAPELLVLNFGGNERVDGDLSVAKHLDDMKQVIAFFKAGAPKAACLLVGPIAHGETVKGKVVIDPDLKTIYEAQRKAADEAGCAFFDTLAAMGGDGAIAAFRKKKLIGGDLSHLNGKGHKVVGGLIADWLLAAYDGWKSEQAAKAP